MDARSDGISTTRSWCMLQTPRRKLRSETGITTRVSDLLQLPLLPAHLPLILLLFLFINNFSAQSFVDLVRHDRSFSCYLNHVFSILALLTTWTRSSGVGGWGDCPMHCRVFSGIAGWLLHTACQQQLPYPLLPLCASHVFGHYYKFPGEGEDRREKSLHSGSKSNIFLMVAFRASELLADDNGFSSAPGLHLLKIINFLEEPQAYWPSSQCPLSLLHIPQNPTILVYEPRFLFLLWAISPKMRLSLVWKKIKNPCNLKR